MKQGKMCIYLLALLTKFDGLCRCTIYACACGYCWSLEARGTKERAQLGLPFFSLEIFILKIMMFRDLTTVLNERKHLKMIIRSVPHSVSLI
jgi:hypothetical protein